MKVGGVTTTEVCNISCTMCHFNGPNAIRKMGALNPGQVKKYLAEIPSHQQVPFAGTGEFFMDTHALEYLNTATELGHEPYILTNGQLLVPELIDQILKSGVRSVRISVDSIDPDHYRKVRQGGELSIILDACDYLKQQKEIYPDLRVEVQNTMFLNTFPKQDEFTEFWRGKVDAVSFNAEYYDILKFRNKFFEPKERNDCEMSVYLLPTGQMAPCCAMMVYQHYNNVEWLPHIDDTTPQEAYDQFTVQYADPTSDLRQVCQKCEWWIMWAKDEEGNTPYWRSVQLTEPVPAVVASSAAIVDEPSPALEAELDQLQTELKQAQEQIWAMESSKFWKIRTIASRFNPTLVRKENPDCLQSPAQELTVASQYQAELNRLNATIDWMKTSRLWKLRTIWFELKQVLGLPSERV